MVRRRCALSSDGTGVGDVELHGRAGRKWRGERDRCLVKLAGVVGVGVEGGDGEGYVVAGDADALPIERRRDLQRNVGERRLPSLRTVTSARTAIWLRRR